MIPFNFIVSVSFLSAGVILFFLGLIIYRENPRQSDYSATGMLLLFASFGSLQAALGSVFADAPPVYWQQTLLGRLSYIWEMLFAALLYFSLIFPKETGSTRFRSRLVKLIFIPHIFRSVLLLCFPTFSSLQSITEVNLPEGFWGIMIRPLFFLFTVLLNLLEDFYTTHIALFALLNLLYILGANFFMSASRRTIADISLHKQVGMVVWGLRLATALYAFVNLLPQMGLFSLQREVRYGITLLAVIIGLSTIAGAIIRYQFLTVRRVLRNGLVFSIASGAITGGFVMIYGQTKKLMSFILDTDLPILEVLFLLIALFMFQPFINALDNLISKIQNREHKDFETSFQSFSMEILRNFNTLDLRKKIVQALSERLDAQPFHLFILGDKGEFHILDPDDNKLTETKFEQDSELSRALQKTAKPTKSEKIKILVSDKRELYIIDMLNALLFAPFIRSGRLYGFLSIGNKRNGKSFTSSETRVLEVFCTQVAIALENAQLYKLVRYQKQFEEELSVAREIQRMLLPIILPKTSYYDIAAMNVPSKEVGGDYYDFVQLDSSNLGVAIGDIAGKGIPGAILMSNLQASFRASAYRFRNPDQVNTEVNRQMVRTTAPEKYATFFYTIFDAERKILRYCNSGHNDPILRSHEGKIMMLHGGGPIVGVDDAVCYEEYKLQFSSGDLLVLYTDGITEALNADGCEFGEERLCRLIDRIHDSDAQTMINMVYDEIQQFTQRTNQYDDMTMVVLRIR